MAQSAFGNPGLPPVSPDVQAARTAMQIKLLRAQAELAQRLRAGGR
jgi:hypothetical protein